MKTDTKEYFRNFESTYKELTGRKSGLFLEWSSLGKWSLTKPINGLSYSMLSYATASEIRAFLNGVLMEAAVVHRKDIHSVMNHTAEPHWYKIEEVKK